MIDVNVTLSRWPFRRLAADEPAALVAALRKRDVTEAWAASFDGIFHKDLAAANARLAKDCRTYGEGMLLPFGSVNPKLPDWQEDLRRCHEEHRMRYLFPVEVELLAQQSGFNIEKSEEFLTRKRPSENSWGVMYLLRKSG